MSDDPKQAEETISIDSGGNEVSVRMHGSATVTAAIRGDATAEYQWDGKVRGGSWVENVGTEHTGSADYDETLTTGFAAVRIRCSSGTSGSGDEATITLSAGGG